METFYQMMKMMLVFVFSLEQLFAPKIAGGDFAPSEPVKPGDETKYVHWHGFTSSFVVHVTQ